MKYLLLFVPLMFTMNAQANRSRYTCDAKCVVFKSNDTVPFVVSIGSLPTAHSNYSEEAAVKKLESKCALIARVQYGAAATWMISKAIKSYSSQEAKSISASIGFGRSYGLFHGSRYAGSSVSYSEETASSVALSDEAAHCSLNENIPQSEVEEYNGARAGG